MQTMGGGGGGRGEGGGGGGVVRALMPSLFTSFIKGVS